MPTPTLLTTSSGTTGDWVDARAFRALLRSLVDTLGWNWQVLATAVGLPRKVAYRLLLPVENGGIRRIRRVDALVLLNARPGQLRQEADRRVSPTTAQRDLAALLRAGWTAPTVAATLGLPAGLTEDLLLGRWDSVACFTSWQLAALRERIESRRRCTELSAA